MPHDGVRAVGDEPVVLVDSEPRRHALRRRGREIERLGWTRMDSDVTDVMDSDGLGWTRMDRQGMNRDGLKSRRLRSTRIDQIDSD
jgi:hypothetical protein